MIKKANKNLIELKPEFFQLFADNIPNNNIINLNENDIAIEKDREIIINKINSLENELNHVNNLIHYIDEKLLLYENNNNLKIKIKNKENTAPNANKGELMEIKTINNSGKEKMKEIIQNTPEEQKEFIFKGEENLPFTINEYTEFFQDKNEIIFNGKRKDSLFSNSYN